MGHKFDKRWVITNMANAITLFGIMLCQLLKLFIFIDTDWIMGILCVAAGVMVTDWMDGSVARYFEGKGYKGSVSDFGKAIDRFRDKDFQLTMFLFLIWNPVVDHRLKFILYFLVAAEIVLLATLFVAVKKKTDAGATNWGKRKMVTECIVILAGLALIAIKKHGISVPLYINYPVIGAAMASAFFAAMSIRKHVIDCSQ